MPVLVACVCVSDQSVEHMSRTRVTFNEHRNKSVHVVNFHRPKAVRVTAALCTFGTVFS